jgi:hypothetical protein
MRFSFLFDNYIWANLRASIHRLEKTSLWYRILYAFLDPILQARVEKLIQLDNQLSIDTTPDDRLYIWGQRLKVNRNLDEDLEQYRVRLDTIKLNKLGIAISQKIRLLSLIANISPDVIKWHKINPYHFTIGGEIGQIVSSRDYALLAFRLYVRETANADWIFISEELDRLSKGGQVCEIWVETISGPIIDREPGTNQLKNYEVY